MMEISHKDQEEKEMKIEKRKELKKLKDLRMKILIQALVLY